MNTPYAGRYGPAPFPSRKTTKPPTERKTMKRYLSPEAQHVLAVIIYELLDEHSTLTAKEKKICRAGTDDLLPFLPMPKRQLFLNRGGISRRTLINTHQYLVQIGSIEIAGPIKTLIQHPNEARQISVETPEPEPLVPASSRNEFQWLGPENRRPPTLTLEEANEETVEETVDPPTETPDELEQVDADQLANAIANGMWTRFEWALTEVGHLRERIAQLEEAIQVKNEEISRLRSLNRTPTVKEMARQLLP